MMRRGLLPLLVCCALILTLLQPGSRASAHVLRQDGAAAAVMHIQPDDNPMAGTATVVAFDFGPSDLGFNLDTYSTTVKLTRNGTDVSDKPLVVSSSRGGHVTLIFPEAAVYELTVDGSAKQSQKRFAITFEVRVDRGANGQSATQGNAQTVLFMSGASLCILALIARRAIVSGGRYKA